jgi:hypothetical protein
VQARDVEREMRRRARAALESRIDAPELGVELLNCPSGIGRRNLADALNDDENFGTRRA